MLTKVVEPGLGFLVLFTDPRSDDALASYDVSKLQLSIAGIPNALFPTFQTVYDTAQVVVRFTAKRGALKCANDRRWGSAQRAPNIFCKN